MEPKGFSFPVLSPVSMDYKPGVEYSADIGVIRGVNKIIVTHKLVGDSIIAEFIKKQKAVFGCMVSLPSTMYRETFVCKTNELTAIQEIDYQDSGYSQNVQLPLFLPVIIKDGGDDIDGSAKSSGLGDLWQEGKVKFPTGGIIGSTDWMIIGGVAGGIVTIKADESIEPGTIKVQFVGEAGFRFQALVNPSFFNYLQSPGDFNTRDPQRERIRVKDVYIHILSRGLEKLSLGELEEWEEHFNLKMLANMLKLHGLPGDPPWNEPDFDAERVATTIAPYEFYAEKGEDDV